MEVFDIFKELSSIDEEIPEIVKSYAEAACSGYVSYVSYLQKLDDELVMRTFAYKKIRNKALMLKEVVRRITGYDGYIFRNVYYTYLAGYQTFFSDNDDWSYREDKYFKIGCTVLNKELILDTKYKYCAYNGKSFFTDYISLYNEYPGLEMLSKLGLRPSKLYLNKGKKDKQFIHFLRNNIELIKPSQYKYTPRVVVYAYDHKLAFDFVVERFDVIKYFRKDIGVDIDRLVKYLKNNKIDYALYDDYLKTIKYLGLDLSDTKNAFPKDFKRMHDLRVLEYASVVEKERKNIRKFRKRFEVVSSKYKMLNYTGTYSIMIANSIDDLRVEGIVLHHCVGKLGYDKKMADEKSLILFIRENENISMPYVTMEFDPKTNKVLQLYGNYDSTPDQNVCDFVNNEWLKFSKKQLKKLA